MAALSSIEASGLACVRGGRLVFRDVGFSLAAGQALIVEGPNGAGKTSLLRLIAGFLKPAAGAIRVRTQPGGAKEHATLIGWLGHQDGAKAQLSARENLGFHAAFCGGTGDIDGALEFAGLKRAADLPAQYLSAGQKRRLALARLKLVDRPLWLLDEPLAALDSAGRALATSLIESHCAAGGIAIAATHEPLAIDAANLKLGAP